MHRQRLEKRAGDLWFFMMLSALVFVLGLCMVPPVLAQTAPDLINFNGTPPQNAAALAIGTLCPNLPQSPIGATKDLSERCGEMAGNAKTNPSQTGNALLEVSPYKVPTQGTSQVEGARAQIANIAGGFIANIGGRLAALRGGAPGISMQGLSFNINGKILPGTMLASLIPGSGGSDITIAHEPTIFPRFETSTNGETSPRAILASLLAQSEGKGTRSAENPDPFGKLGVFANGTFTLGDKDATSREAGFDFHTFGMTAGVDYRFTDKFILGAAFGFASTDADLDSSGGQVDAKQYSGSIYGTYYFERFYVDGIATVGRNTFDSKRNIVYSITTPVSQTAKGDTDGTHYSLGVDGGYEFRSGGFTYGPYARLNYFKIDVNGFAEHIDNTNMPGFGLALEFDDQTVESLRTALGGQATYALSTRVGVFVPQVLFEWVHEFLNNQRTIRSTYVNDPNKVPLDLVTDNPDRNFFNLGLGLSAVFQRGTSAFIYYQTALAFENITKHDIVVGVRLAF
jgi:outer membrane autotransporter protein